MPLVVEETTGAEDDPLAGSEQLGAPPDLDLEPDDVQLVVAHEVGGPVLQEDGRAEPLGRGLELVDQELAARGIDPSPPAGREHGLDGSTVGRGVLGEVGVVVGVVDALERQRAEGDELLDGGRATVVEGRQESVLVRRQPERVVLRVVERGVGRPGQVAEGVGPVVDETALAHQLVVRDPQDPSGLGRRAPGERAPLQHDHRRAPTGGRDGRGHPRHAGAHDDDVDDGVPLVAPALAGTGHGCSTQAARRSGTCRCSGIRSGPMILSIHAWTCQMRRSW